MVGIAQSVERLVVVQEVAGSSPVTHPNAALVDRSWPAQPPRSEQAVHLDAEAFEALVVDELDQLPDDMVDGLENLVFVVEDRPEDGSLDTLGLYEGWALTERDRYGFGEMPDRIILYREPLLADLRRRGRTPRRDPCDPRARDRALLRHRRRPAARAGLGLSPAGYPESMNFTPRPHRRHHPRRSRDPRDRRLRARDAARSAARAVRAPRDGLGRDIR